MTGAAGFIGHHLVAQLPEGIECVGVDSERSGNWSRVSPKIKAVKRDISDISFEEWLDLLEGTDVLFHLAAEKYNSSSMTPSRVLDVNVIATDRLFRAAAKAGVARIVFTSSLYAYGSRGPKAMEESDLPTPSTHYGISKLAGEHLLRAACAGSSTTWNVARLFFIYGPGQFSNGGYKSVIVRNFENYFSNSPFTVCGDGLQTLDYVFVDDCVLALLRLAHSNLSGKVVNVATSKQTSVFDLVSKIKQITGSNLPINHIAQDTTHETKRWGTSSQIKNDFGWQANVTLEDGLQKTFNWISSETQESK